MSILSTLEPVEFQVEDKMEAYKQILGKRIVKIKKIHNTEFEVTANSEMATGMCDLRFILTADDGTEITV